jgi:hypothetical protein
LMPIVEEIHPLLRGVSQLSDDELPSPRPKNSKHASRKAFVKLKKSLPPKRETQ